MRSLTKIAGLALPVVLLLALLAPVADAAPDEAELAALQAKANELKRTITIHKRANEPAVIAADIWATVSLYRECGEDKETSRLRLSLVRMVGDLTKSRHDRVRRTALDALGELEDENGTRFVKPLLKPDRDDEPNPVTLAAIDAAASIGADDFVVPLLRIVDRSRCHEEASEAMSALARFSHSEKQRERIVKELAKTLTRARNKAPVVIAKAPATDPAAENKEIPPSRWTTLAPLLPEVLNELTGQDINHPDEWLDMVEDNRRDVGKLFLDE